MDRRSALRNLAFISVGTIILPACSQNEKRTSATLKNLKLTARDEQLMEALTQHILPSAGGYGARELQSHLFVLIMIDDCAPPEEQQQFMTGLRMFKTTVQKKYDCSFFRCSDTQKNQLLSELEEKKSIPDEVQHFYQTVKRLTIQSYTTSREYMEKIAGYKMLPGKYKGCVPVKQI
jgi:hypothetical protein